MTQHRNTTSTNDLSKDAHSMKASSTVPFAVQHLSELDTDVGVSVSDALVIADISRSTLYRLVARGELELRRIGVRRSVITAGSLQALMRGAR